MEGIGSVADVHNASDRLAISVVVPVRDGMPWLDDQLRGLASQTSCGPFEVVVADNGSSDGTRELVERWACRDPRIRLVDAAARLGPAAARNCGARAARGPLLAFCDADDVVRPGWLAGLAEALADADVVAGVFDFGSLQGRTDARPSPAATRQFGFLPFGLGANMGVRVEAFKAAGGFDEHLLVGEDIDLSWRLQLAGGHFAVTSAAVVAKREPAGGLATLRTACAYGQSGAELFRRYRVEGMRRDVRGALKAWVWLLVAAPGLLVPSRRPRWARTLGVRAGRLAGSLHGRTFFP